MLSPQPPSLTIVPPLLVIVALVYVTRRHTTSRPPQGARPACRDRQRRSPPRNHPRSPRSGRRHRSRPPGMSRGTRIVTCAASISVARLESRGPPRIVILLRGDEVLVPRVWLAQVSPRDPASTLATSTRRAWRLVTRSGGCGGGGAAATSRCNCSISRCNCSMTVTVFHPSSLIPMGAPFVVKL